MNFYELVKENKVLKEKIKELTVVIAKNWDKLGLSEVEVKKIKECYVGTNWDGIFGKRMYVTIKSGRDKNGVQD